MTFQKHVTVEWSQYDRYRRILGKVRVNGVDVGLAQIQAGLAWHFKRYERDQLPEDRLTYANAEVEARAARTGLWVDPNPIEPWEWRRGRR